MIEKACSDFSIDLKRSYMIGDRQSDIDLAINAGLKPVLVKTGYGKSLIESGYIPPQECIVVDDIINAARSILNTK
jgi:D-glycero-D-manno-heptose 1,7-bisphosphate phosphatase